MRKPPHLLQRYFPVLDWGRGYDGETLTGDLVAAVIVTIMLIPQSLAYAMLAGLPPQVGLYASILPLAVYALFGGKPGLLEALHAEAVPVEVRIERERMLELIETHGGEGEQAPYEDLLFALLLSSEFLSNH